MNKALNSGTQSVQATQGGFTLVELMVAIVLGLLLTASVVQSYLSSKQTYRITEGVGRVQENARFSLHFLSKDLRNAGYSGCIGRVRNRLKGNADDYISFVASIVGWDYAGTTSSNTAFTLSGSALSLPGSVNNWSRTNGAATASLPAYLSGLVVAGADVLWFKSYDELDIEIKTHEATSSSITTEGNHGLPDNSILMVGDCSGVEIFQHLSQGSGSQSSITAPTGASGDPGNRKPNGGDSDWAREYTPQDHIFGFEQTYYYIGAGASGLPSLFRYRTNLPEVAITTADIIANTEELVEGVETMQVLFGEDTDGDDKPNNYVSASQVVAWDNVVSTRVGLLLRSPNNSTDEDQAANYTLLDSIEFTHPADDNILRYAVNSTVQLRNRGLDKELAFYLCDSTDESPAEDNGTPTCDLQ